MGQQRENYYLQDSEINFLKDKLFGEKERIRNKRNFHKIYPLDPNELSDPLDEASIIVQANQLIHLNNREDIYLKKINHSLDSIASGIYGLCEECNNEIGFERLSARITAELCISCKLALEHDQNTFFKDNLSGLYE